MAITDRRYYDADSEMWITIGQPANTARRIRGFFRFEDNNEKIYGQRSHYEEMWHRGSKTRDNRKDNSSDDNYWLTEMPELFVAGHTPTYSGYTSRGARGRYESQYVAMAFDYVDSYPSCINVCASDAAHWANNDALKIHSRNRKYFAKLLFLPSIVTFSTGLPEDFLLHGAGYMYDDDGEKISGDFDVYFSSTPTPVVEFCNAQGFDYPCGLTQKPWIYSAVYENNTLTGIKAYVSYGYD